ncbi:MAG: transposase, partial [Planctomycetes bacterium]|nr:transposase [Planctomycetota bacterium]
MEEVLDVYQQPYDPKRPVVCFDERPNQLVGEIRQAIPAMPGKSVRYDYAYKRNGVANLFMMFEPLVSKRQVKVTERRTKKELAECFHELV